MKIRLSYRALFALLGLICLALVGYALHLQFGPEKQQPCPLCILQRYAYLMIALVSFVAALHGAGSRLARWYAGTVGVFAASGIVFAVWQLTKGETMHGCIADPIGEFVNRLPMSAWWDAKLFFATGGCADKYPPTLGLSVPVWSLIFFILIAMLAGLMLIRARQQR